MIKLKKLDSYIFRPWMQTLIYTHTHIYIYIERERVRERERGRQGERKKEKLIDSNYQIARYRYKK